MKKILLILFLLMLAAVSWADTPEQSEIDELNEKLSTEGIRMELIPMNGAFGVNMRDTRYPQRDNGSDLYFADDLDSNFNSFQPGNEYGGHPFENVYGNQHIVLLGGIEGVPNFNPEEVLTYRREKTGWFLGDIHSNVDGFRIKSINWADIEITVISSTDFMYISQSNPIYQRPYHLYAVPRYSFTDDQGSFEPETFSDHEGLPIIRFSSEDPTTEKISWPSPEREYSNLWFDLILALPYDSYNETGVSYDNREYPLSDAEDYSSTVTFTVRWTVTYEIEYNEGRWDGDTYDGESWNHYETRAIPFKKDITIPFSGFSSTIEMGPLDDTGSLVITPTPNASNLSLDYEDTGVPVEVADIHFILNHGKNTEPTDAWLFLSASPDPFVKNQNGFVLVHDDAGSMLTSYNSAKYKVSVRGIGDSASNTDGAGGSEVVFEGDETAGDFYSSITGPKSYIRTITSGDLTLPHLSNWKDESGDWDIFPDYVEYPTNYQYSEFQGVVSVEIEETPMEADGMDSGRYTSEIYIHVMTGW